MSFLEFGSSIDFIVDIYVLVIKCIKGVIEIKCIIFYKLWFNKVGS